MQFPILNNRGIALPMVLGLIVIITLLGFTAMSLADNQTLMVNRYQQQEKALHYAEAGVYKYLNLLNADRDFYKSQESNELQNIDVAFESGFYRLTVIPPTTSNPVVTIRSTGWTKSHPDIKRTVEVTVNKKEFVQTLYGSGREINDKGNEVWWARGDVVDGSLHTNGSLYIDGTGGDGSTGPVFNGPVTYVQGLTLKKGTEQFNGGPPQKVDPLIFPPTNSSLKTLAKKGGYYYEGRTCIHINGNELVIRNKNDAAERSKPLPANGVIYVDGGTGGKWDNNTGNVFVSGTLDGRLTIAAANDIYITAWDPTNWEEPIGNVPRGTYTGGLYYKDFNGSNIADIDDMLGLIAGGYVRILHNNWPRDDGRSWSTKSTNDVAPKNITIHAAIFALNNSFEYEYYNSGAAKDTITLIGSITQNKRGAVGTYNGQRTVTGYNKNYSHDPRMLYDMPPHFLEPVNSGWEIRSWREVNS